MTLMITVIFAIIATVVWYMNENRTQYKLGTLCLMLWGASLMWFVDAIVEYAELGAEYFVPAAEDMINDGFLGLCVCALAMIIWLVIFLANDPKNVIKSVLKAK